MKQITLSIGSDADGKTTVAVEGRPATEQELMQALHALAVARSAMPTPVSADDPLGRREEVPLVSNPYITRHHYQTGETILGFRHPGYGWLHFSLSPDLQRNLFGDICKRLEASQRQPPGR